MVLSIIVRFTFSGIHHWPGAPQDVEEQYLVVPHRHLFHVEAVKAVTHEERDIEFIALQRQMISYCAIFADPHAMSCETMAVKLLEHFGLSRCRVLEDGENGAEVTV